jgi:4'-phosphopantetheinyl transferase
VTTAAPATVCLRTFALDAPASEVQRLRAVLSAAETARAESLRHPRDRDRYVVGRGRLREVLGALSGHTPAALALVTTGFGKPELPGSGLFFNLAHAEGQALLAVTTAGRIGVDLERLQPVRDRDLIAGRFFAAAEIAALRRVPQVERDAAFLRCWTRKEAYVKAVGNGLSLSLQEFAVSTEPGRVPSILWSRDPAERLRWSVIDLSDRCPGHVAAAVVEAPRVSPVDGAQGSEMECR